MTIIKGDSQEQEFEVFIKIARRCFIKGLEIELRNCVKNLTWTFILLEEIAPFSAQALCEKSQSTIVLSPKH